jgi:hypothetical protein
MSATFSAKWASRESLKVSCLCGLRRCSRHRSATNTCDTSMPSCRFRCFAISRLDQCDKLVCPGGLVLLRARMRARTRSSCDLGLPGCGMPRRPSIPDSAYRTGHNRAVFLRHQPTQRSGPPNGLHPTTTPTEPAKQARHPPTDRESDTSIDRADQQSRHHVEQTWVNSLMNQ